MSSTMLKTLENLHDRLDHETFATWETTWYLDMVIMYRNGLTDRKHKITSRPTESVSIVRYADMYRFGRQFLLATPEYTASKYHFDDGPRLLSKGILLSAKGLYPSLVLVRDARRGEDRIQLRYSVTDTVGGTRETQM